MQAAADRWFPQAVHGRSPVEKPVQMLQLERNDHVLVALAVHAHHLLVDTEYRRAAEAATRLAARGNLEVEFVAVDAGVGLARRLQCETLWVAHPQKTGLAILGAGFCQGE